MSKQVPKYFAVIQSESGEELSVRGFSTWDEAKTSLLEDLGGFYEDDVTVEMTVEVHQSLNETGRFEFDGVYCNEHDSDRNRETCELLITGAQKTVVPDWIP